MRLRGNDAFCMPTIKNKYGMCSVSGIAAVLRSRFFGCKSAYVNSSPNSAMLKLTFTFSFARPERVEPRAYKANFCKILKHRAGMSWLTLSRSIPTAIFSILASYALWESHAPFKKRQRLRQTVAFIFLYQVYLLITVLDN